MQIAHAGLLWSIPNVAFHPEVGHPLQVLFDHDRFPKDTFLPRKEQGPIWKGHEIGQDMFWVWTNCIQKWLYLFAPDAYMCLVEFARPVENSCRTTGSSVAMSSRAGCGPAELRAEVAGWYGWMLLEESIKRKCQGYPSKSCLPTHYTRWECTQLANRN